MENYSTVQNHSFEYGPLASTAVIVFVFSSALFSVIVYFYCSHCNETQQRLQSLPVVPYSKMNESSSQCVICLSEFEELEDLKVIPGCGHVFHPPCIDRWLAEHRSCPVCRCSEIFGTRHAAGEVLVEARLENSSQ